MYRWCRHNVFIQLFSSLWTYFKVKDRSCLLSTERASGWKWKIEFSNFFSKNRWWRHRILHCDVRWREVYGSFRRLSLSLIFFVFSFCEGTISGEKRITFHPRPCQIIKYVWVRDYFNKNRFVFEKRRLNQSRTKAFFKFSFIG